MDPNRTYERVRIKELTDAWNNYKMVLMSKMNAETRLTRALSELACDFEKRTYPPNPHPSAEIAGKLAKAYEACAKDVTAHINSCHAKMTTGLQQYTGNFKHPPINENKYQLPTHHREQNVHNLINIFLNLEAIITTTYSDTVARLYARGTNAHPPTQAPFPRHMPPMNVPPPIGVFGMAAVHQALPRYPGQESRGFQGSSESHFFATEPLRHPNPKCEGYRGMSPTPSQDYHNCEGFRGHSPNYPDANRAMKTEMQGPLPQPGMLNTMFQSPQNSYLMSPLEGQRRWSEAAAAEIGASSSDDAVMRRWSMPYEGRADVHGHLPHSLHPPPPPHHNLRRVRPASHMHSYERSRSVTPEWQMGASGTVHLTSAADGLVDALQLLSHRPSSHTMHNPTPNNTTPSHSIHQGIAEVWPEEGPTSGFEPLSYQLERELGVVGAEMASYAPRNAGIVGTPPIPENAPPMREFTLFGADDTLSCLRSVTSSRDNAKN